MEGDGEASLSLPLLNGGGRSDAIFSRPDSAGVACARDGLVFAEKLTKATGKNASFQALSESLNVGLTGQLPLEIVHRARSLNLSAPASPRHGRPYTDPVQHDPGAGQFSTAQTLAHENVLQCATETARDIVRRIHLEARDAHQAVQVENERLWLDVQQLKERLDFKRLKERAAWVPKVEQEFLDSVQECSRKAQTKCDQELAQMRGETDGLRQQIELLQGEQAVTKKELEERERENGRLRAQLDILQRDAETKVAHGNLHAAEEAEAMHGKVKALTEENSRLTCLNSALKAQESQHLSCMAELRKSLEGEQENVKLLQSHLDAIKAQAAAEAASLKAQEDGGKAELLRRLAAAEMSRDEAASENKRLQDSDGQRAQTELVLRRSLDDARNVLITLESQLEWSKMQKDEITAELQSSVKAIEIERDQERNKVSALQTQLATSRVQACERIAELPNRMNAARSETPEGEACHKIVHERYVSGMDSPGKTVHERYLRGMDSPGYHTSGVSERSVPKNGQAEQHSLEEIAKLRQQLLAVEADREQLRAELHASASSKPCRNSMQDIIELNRQLVSLRAECDQVKADNTCLQRTVAQRERTIIDLRKSDEDQPRFVGQLEHGLQRAQSKDSSETDQGRQSEHRLTSSRHTLSSARGQPRTPERSVSTTKGALDAFDESLRNRDDVGNQNQRSPQSMPGGAQWKVDVEQRLHELFKRLDTNGDGSVNKRELIKGCDNNQDIAELFGLPRKIRQEDGTRDDFERIFQGIDVNDDREIDWPEFKAFFIGYAEARGQSNIRPPGGSGQSNSRPTGSSATCSPAVKFQVDLITDDTATVTTAQNSPVQQRNLAISVGNAFAATSGEEISPKQRNWSRDQSPSLLSDRFRTPPNPRSLSMSTQRSLALPPRQPAVSM